MVDSCVGICVVGYNVFACNIGICQFLVDDDRLCVDTVGPLNLFESAMVERLEVLASKCAVWCSDCCGTLGCFLGWGVVFNNALRFCSSSG